MIAVDANTLIFGDPANNVLWRLEQGKKPYAIMRGLHVHWTVIGRDGGLYAESFQEMGGALFRIDASGAGKHQRIAEERDIKAFAFAVDKDSKVVFQRGERIVERSANGTIKPFRGNGRVAKGEPRLREVIAYAWSDDGTLYLSDDGQLRRIEKDGVIRSVARIEGKLLDREMWNSTGSPRIWSIAIDDKKRIYAALPDLGQVIRIDQDGSQHTIDRYSAGWRVTAVATFGDAVYLLESSDDADAGQRVRVIKGLGSAKIFGQIASEDL